MIALLSFVVLLCSSLGFGAEDEVPPGPFDPPTQRWIGMPVEAHLDYSMVHYSSDSFRSNRMGWHSGVGLGLKPKLRFLELQARYDFLFLRVEESHPYHAQLDDRYMGLASVGFGLCVPAPITDTIMTELVLSPGWALIHIHDYGLRLALNTGLGWRAYAAVNDKLKIGLTFDARSVLWIYREFDPEYLKELFRSDKEHIERDALILLGVVVAYGG